MASEKFIVDWTDKDGHQYHMVGRWLDCQAAFEALKASPKVKKVSTRPQRNTL